MKSSLTRIRIQTFLGMLLFPVLFHPAVLAAAEKGIFDYAAQNAASPTVKKIIFIADAGTHGGKGNHEFVAGSILLAREINFSFSNAYAVVYTTQNWPKDLSHADSLIVALNHGGRAAEDPQIAEAVARGAGYMAIHFGVEVLKGKQGD